jgi:hypothetical protein
VTIPSAVREAAREYEAARRYHLEVMFAEPTEHMLAVEKWNLEARYVAELVADMVSAARKGQ